MTRSRRTARALALCGAFLLAASACSGSASVGTTPTVSRSELERQAAATLAAKVGRAPDKVECAGDLEGVKGKTQRCTVYDGAVGYGATVTVTSVEGTDVGFGITVEDQPSTGR